MTDTPRGPLDQQPDEPGWWDFREWSLAWQLGIAVLVILVGALVAAVISDARYGAASRSAATTTTTASSSLVPLTIAAPSHEATYDRAADFGGWVDVADCKDTRAELLIRSSQASITFTRSTGCTVKTGKWVDPWSGAVTTVAHDFQIDHTVPLANAWRSGAWAWSHLQRVAYANDLTDTDHLVPILASENESKGDSGPDQWKPPSRGAWCRYALDWDHIEAKWHLTVTQTEWNALVAMAATC